MLNGNTQHITTIEEDNEMNLQEIYDTTMKNTMSLAKTINKIVRGTITRNKIPDYLELSSSEFVFTVNQCKMAYRELVAILKKYRLSINGNPKAVDIVYAYYRLIESYSNFQNAKKTYSITEDQQRLIKSLKLVRQHIRSIYVCKL